MGKYHQALHNDHILQESIETAVSEMLHIRPDKSEELSLTGSSINITAIDLSPNATKPRDMRISGAFRCKVVHKKEFMDALNAAKRQRRISGQFAERANVKKGKVAVQQFKLQ